ncbi:MAG: OsmC family protein [Polyangiaceae bacterium]|jgi:organic hydroperoxide reductase OsmC/OhrA|nr:OsmC family protein [Polyangiaceae bacterium]MBK8940414.1 OsmC family protein [Polyangiaceae bacterium]
MHEFPLRLSWSGSTAADYSRNATASVDGKPDLAVSSGPTYGGDPSRWNPEDLLGASLATCHFLTFLALARKFRLDVRAYDDHSTVVLDTVDGVTKVTQIRLAPTIRVAEGSDEAKVRDAFQKAHKYCFIGNSISAKIVMEPTVVIGD